MFSPVFTKSFWSSKKANELGIVVIIFFVSECLTKLLDFSGIEHYRVGVVIKMIFLGYVFARRLISTSLLWGLGLLGLCFIISQTCIDTGLTLKEKVFENMLYFAKYTFIFVLANYIIKLPNKDVQVEKAVAIVMVILRLNFFLILSGLLFKIGLFKTYDQYRFGYDGLIQMNSHASYIYCFASIFVVYNYLKSRKFSPDLFMIVVSGLLVGTKTLYLFYLLIAVYLFFHLKLYKKLAFYLSVSAVIVLIVIGRDFISTFFTTHLNGYIRLYNEFGIITAATSTRDQLLIETIALTSEYNWTFINYLIGGGFFNILRTEMSFVDLFLFWGVIGIIIYLKIYHRYILKNYMHHPFLKYAILSVLIAAFFGGNYFTNAVTAIYILVFSNFFILEKTKNLSH